MLTVGQGDDLAGSFGLCHSPDIFYRIGLALTGLSTEMMREVTGVLAGVWSVVGDPFEAEAWVLDVGFDDGGEYKLGTVDVDLHEGEGNERGEEGSHWRGDIPSHWSFILFSPLAFREKQADTVVADFSRELY